MNRRHLLGIAIAAVCCCMAPASIAQTLTPLRIGFIPVADFLTVFIAKDQGFFEKNGLDATLTQMSNQQVIVSALVSGTADMATTTPINVLQAEEAGIKLRVVAGTHVTPLTSLSVVIARAGSGIEKPADLIGKKIAINGLAAIHHLVVVRWLRENGVDPKRVTFIEVPFPQMADVLKSGQVDAVMTTDPFSRRIVDDKIGSAIGAPFANTPDGTTPSLYAVSRKWAEANPAAYAGVQKAIAEAAAFAKANDSGARDSLAKWSKQPPAAIAATPMPNFNPVITKDKLDFWLAEAVKQGVLRGTADTAALVGAK